MPVGFRRVDLDSLMILLALTTVRVKSLEYVVQRHGFSEAASDWDSWLRVLRVAAATAFLVVALLLSGLALSCFRLLLSGAVCLVARRGTVARLFAATSFG